MLLTRLRNAPKALPRRSERRSSTARRTGQALLLAGVVELPGYGVEEADEGSFADAAAEEGVCGEGAEGVVADLGVGGGGAAVNEGEVVVCREDGGVEEDEPDIDSKG